MLPSLNLCIPAASDSPRLIGRIKETLEWEGWSKYDGQVILVIDGGMPDLMTRMHQLFPESKRLVMIELAESSGVDACLLCALQHSAASFNVTLDPLGIYLLKDIETLMNLHKRSNCQVIYGYSEKITSGFLGNIAYKMRANLFSLFTGMPAYVSDFRLISRAAMGHLSQDNQQTFLLDKSLLSNGTIYAGLPVQINKEFFESKDGSRFMKTKLSIENLISASFIPEILMVLLLLLNIYFLLHSWIWQSLAVAIGVAIAMVNVYNVKWRTVRSYRLKDIEGN